MIVQITYTKMTLVIMKEGQFTLPSRQMEEFSSMKKALQRACVLLDRGAEDLTIRVNGKVAMDHIDITMHYRLKKPVLDA